MHLMQYKPITIYFEMENLNTTVKYNYAIYCNLYCKAIKCNIYWIRLRTI